MKKIFVFILLVTSFYGKVFSENEMIHISARKIELHGFYAGKVKRSPIPEKDPVEAFIINNRITIHFNSPCPNEVITVSVWNENGQVVTEETYTINAPAIISLYIDWDEEESYTMEISVANGRLTGEF